MSRELSDNGSIINPEVTSYVSFSHGIELGGSEELSAKVTYVDNQDNPVVPPHVFSAKLTDPVHEDGPNEAWLAPQTTQLTEEEAALIVGSAVYWERKGKDGYPIAFPIYPWPSDIIEYLTSLVSKTES